MEFDRDYYRMIIMSQTQELEALKKEIDFLKAD